LKGETAAKTGTALSTRACIEEDPKARVFKEEKKREKERVRKRGKGEPAGPENAHVGPGIAHVGGRWSLSIRVGADRNEGTQLEKAPEEKRQNCGGKER